MPRKPARSRRLMVESLESRAMLAGNVTVAVTDGVLQIQGDELGNTVELRQLTTPPSSDGEWPGVRLQIMTPGGTINGGGSSLIVEGVKRGAAIGLGGGNNTLRAQNLPDVPNVITAASLNLPGNVTIASLEGNDNILVSIRNAATMTVRTGDGADRITLYGWVNKLTVNSDPPIPASGTPRGAHDVVTLSYLTSSGPVAVNTGIGDDEVHIVRGAQINGTLDINVAGNGAVRFERGPSGYPTPPMPTLNGVTTITGGTGGIEGLRGLSIFVSANVNGNFTANLSSGKDMFTGWSTVCTATMTVNLGGGADSAAFIDFTSAATDLDGGDGIDKLTVGPNTEFGTGLITGFESD